MELVLNIIKSGAMIFLCFLPGASNIISHGGEAKGRNL
jgi:hypothetical protein